MFWCFVLQRTLWAEFLWAKDLSEQDQITEVFGFSANLLPILMVVTQWFQMKLTSMQLGPQMSEAQRINAKMMRFMPFMFLIFLYFFSSALVLYWTVQNLMTILQTLITKRNRLRVRKVMNSKEIRVKNSIAITRKGKGLYWMKLVRKRERLKFLGFKIERTHQGCWMERLYKRLNHYSDKS